MIAMKFCTPFRLSAGLPVIALVTASLALVSCGKKDLFNEADKNSDGLVDKAEFNSYMLGSIFGRADADGDGKVTFAEWRASNPDADKKVFDDLDADKNGSVSFAEASVQFIAKGTGDNLFDAVDADKDGRITREEAAAYMRKMEAKAQEASVKNKDN